MARPTVPKGLVPSMPAKRAARLLLEARLADVRASEAGVRALDEDAVHDMRVAVRRLRACLDAFRPGRGSERPRRADSLLRGLQRALGAVRDQQLHLDWLERIDGEPAPAARRLAARARADLGAARVELEAALEAWVRGGGWRLERAIEEVSSRGRYDLRLARRALRDRLRKVSLSVELVSALDFRAAHQLRILGKKLRYAAEVYEAANPRALRPVRLALERLQGVLGDLHDAHVRADRLRAEAESAPAEARGAHQALARVAGAEEAAAVAAADRELRRWRRLHLARRLCERVEEGA